MKNFLKIFSVYNQLLIRFPVTTKALTSGVLFVGGDLLAQGLQRQFVKAEKEFMRSTAAKSDGSLPSESQVCTETSLIEKFEVDWERTAVFFVFGTLVCGPAFHYWFNFLAVMPRRLLVRTNIPYSIWKERAIQILSDQIIFAPNYTFIFFTSVGMIERTVKQYRSQAKPFHDFISDSWRESWSHTWHHVKQVYLTTYLTDCLFWPPIQFINFSYVPLRYQFLFANMANLTWNTFLSFMANNDTSTSESEKR